MARFKHWCVVALGVLVTSGCATFQGGPIPLGNLDYPCNEDLNTRSVMSVHPEYQCATVNWIGGDADATMKQRNHVVTTRIYLIDQRYQDFERSLLNESRGANFGTTVAQLTLGAAATLAGGEKTAKALSTINLALTGAKQGFDRDVLFDRTLQVLATQMRASRAKKKELILKRLSTPYQSWPIGLAMSDVLAYENAGTLNAALTDVAESAVEQKTLNEDKVEQAIPTVAYDASTVSTTLQTYLNAADDAVAKERIDITRAAMTAAGVPLAMTVTEFVYGVDSRKGQVFLEILSREAGQPEALSLLAQGLTKK